MRIAILTLGHPHFFVGYIFSIFQIFFFPSHQNPPARVRNDRVFTLCQGGKRLGEGGPPTGFRRGAGGGGGVGRPLHLRHAQGSPGGSLRALAWRQWMRARPSAAPRRRRPLIVPRWVRCGRVLGRGAGRGARLRATTGLLPPTQTLRDGSECWIGIQGRSGCVFGARLGWVWRRVHWRLWGGVHRCGGWGSPR